MLTKNKRLFRFDSCLTLQNSFFFFHLILFSYFIDFVSFRYMLFSYFTDFVVSFRWISFSYFTDFISLDFVFLLYRFHFVGFRFLTLQISFHFVRFRFLTLQISFRWISFSYFTDFVSFRSISFSYFTDFVGFCFRFVSFRFSVYRYPYSLMFMLVIIHRAYVLKLFLGIIHLDRNHACLQD